MDTPENPEQPLSGYEDLSLDDDQTQSDSWSKNEARFSASSSSFQTSQSDRSSATSPAQNSTVNRYDSSASLGTHIGRGVDEVPLVLGVAVVDFNHLVG